MAVQPIPEKQGWVRVTCDGGCGAHVELRAKKLLPVNFYVCNSREHGTRCSRALPSRIPGQISEQVFNAAAHFTGINHRWPTPEEAAAVSRAQGVLAGGLAQLAIQTAQKA